MASSHRLGRTGLGHGLGRRGLGRGPAAWVAAHPIVSFAVFFAALSAWLVAHVTSRGPRLTT